MADTTQLVGSISSLIPSASTGAAASTARNVNNALDKTAFLNLLVTQLKNQDPLKPEDNSQMIAQMAQFSSLEQMQNLNTTMAKGQEFQQLSQAAGMIGKNVLVIPTDASQPPITGLVSEVRQSGGAINVVIDGKEYNSANINQVSDKAIDPTALPAPAPAPIKAGSGAAASSLTSAATAAIATAPSAATTTTLPGM